MMHKKLAFLFTSINCVFSLHSFHIPTNMLHEAEKQRLYETQIYTAVAFGYVWFCGDDPWYNNGYCKPGW